MVAIRSWVAGATMLAATMASATDTLTAVCRNPEGWGVGYENGTAEASADGMKNATNTYTWKAGATEATIITQDSEGAGGMQHSENAVVLVSHGFLTFIVQYPEGVWMHSLYPGVGVVMITRHITGRGGVKGSAAGGLFYATCNISVN